MDEQLILDRYRSLEELGEGGHGRVTLAFDTRIQRRVAIKSVPLSKRVTAGLDEARTAAMLAHPAIVTVHEWETDEDAAYLIMEYVEGASLADLLARFGPLDEDEAAAVLGPVADALEHAHENGVLHLDVKPDNVLIHTDGRVKVADFGIAALTDTSRLARASSGTLGHMAPEQLRGEDVDERTDEWAFAVLAYETLAGSNPFAARSVREALAHAETEEPPFLSEAGARVHPAVDDIVLQALEPHPDHRYPELSTMTEALLPHLGDPSEGRARLASMVAELREEPFVRTPVDVGALAGPARRIAGGLWSGWAAWVGLGWLLPGELAWAGAALALAAGLAAPGLGLALGLLSLCAGLLALSAPAGVIALVVSIGFWLLSGRHGRADGLLAAGSPLAGLAWLPLAPPLLAGLVRRPVRAAVAGGTGFVALTLASVLTGHAPPFLRVGPELLWNARALAGTADLGPLLPAWWLLALAGWAGGAALTSYTAEGAGKGGRMLAVGVGAVPVLGSYVLWVLFDERVTLGGPWLYGVVASLILVVVVLLVAPAPER